MQQEALTGSGAKDLYLFLHTGGVEALIGVMNGPLKFLTARKI